MSSKPGQRFADIIDNIDAIATYTAGLDRRQFLSDVKTIDATWSRLARISEAAVKLGDLAEQIAAEQPWRDIRSIGNRLRHDYDNIDPGVIWKIVRNDLPSLRSACVAAIRHLDQIVPEPAPPPAKRARRRKPKSE